jgi:hypothetical protein
MKQTSRDRMNWLEIRVAELGKLIVEKAREQECIRYLAEIKNGREPVIVDDAEWSVLLPAERDAKLIPHYVILRAELHEMKKRMARPATMQKVNELLDAPWARVILATGTIAEVARLLLHLAEMNIHFLSEPENDSADFLLHRDDREDPPQH